MEKCLRGDGAAWDQLVDTYGALVYTVIRRYSSLPSESEDVLVEVFESLFESLAQLRHEQSLTAWLIRTTVRKAKRLGKVGARSGALETQGREQLKDSPPSERGVTFEFDDLLSALAVRDVDRIEVWRYAITMMMIGDEAAHVMAIHKKDDILFISVETVQGERFEVIRPPMSDETEQILLEEIRKIMREEIEADR